MRTGRRNNRMEAVTHPVYEGRAAEDPARAAIAAPLTGNNKVWERQCSACQELAC